MENFECSHLNFIVLADGDVADVVLLLELLGQGRRHENPAFVRWSAEVTLALLPPGRADAGVELHFQVR